MKVQLTHASFVKGAEGGPGDIVDAPHSQAEAWLTSGAAVLVTEEKPKAKAKQRAKSDGLSKSDMKGESDE